VQQAGDEQHLAELDREQLHRLPGVLHIRRGAHREHHETEVEQARPDDEQGGHGTSECRVTAEHVGQEGLAAAAEHDRGDDGQQRADQQVDDVNRDNPHGRAS